GFHVTGVQTCALPICVLARLMVSDASNTLLDAITEEYNLKGKKAEKVRAGLAPYLNFTAMPQVNRAIFIAAPHRGTSFANHKVRSEERRVGKQRAAGR